jgi:tetratricopeptide (TPR) repeat protein
MFFGKFFKKDHHHFLTQAGKHLAAERYADARVDFLEALSRCPAEAGEQQLQIRQGLEQAGNHLAELNLVEGAHALNAGELEKALDNFTLAREFAVDPQIKARAQAGIKRLDAPPRPAPAAVPSSPKAQSHGGGSCASCKDTGGHGDAEEPADDGSGMHEEDRFFLLVQPLPGDLPNRYCALGEKFAQAYLLIHDGKDAQALPILQEMQLSCENDIVIYELALIMYRAGRAHECEELLNRSLRLNSGNAASYLALVHLKSETGRIPEAIVLLERMMELGIMSDQAQYMLGELHEAAGDQAAALEAWSRALEFPAVAKSAAQRLVPLLAGQGREAEAKYLAKRYLKGCC